MRLRASIATKILAVFLPLVSVPIVVVGYVAVQASAERVNRLVHQELMLQIEATARRINDMLRTGQVDLETLSRMPILDDYHLTRSFRLEAEADFNRENIARIFQDFISRTPYYSRIVCLDAAGRELIKAGDPDEALRDRGEETFFQEAKTLGRQGWHMSLVTRTHSPSRAVIHLAKPFFSGFDELAGVVLIDLDFEKIIGIIQAIKVGERGYAFLLDSEGRNIFHPHYEPYRLSLATAKEPGLQGLVQAMRGGARGWQRYVFEEVEKVAAFVPIQAMNWSLAVTIPAKELHKEAEAVRSTVIQVVALTMILTLTGVSVLSYHLLRPVRRLVNATHRIASGDLTHEIPVRSGDELGELTHAFNRMVRNLSRIQSELVRTEKLASLGRLSAGVAHEIRNPLNAMKAAIVHLRRRRAQDPLIDEYTALVSEEIDRLNRFVTEFLYFAKQSPPRLAPVDINQLVLSVQGLFEERARELGVRFIHHLDPDLPLASLDGHQMEQVLLNLLINALEAMPGGGAVTISTTWLAGDRGPGRPGLLRLIVHDSGEGIAAEHQPNIFDPFFTTKETGTGLGLPLSLGIVESHGGDLRVQSRPGQGTTVCVDLPLQGDEGKEGGRRT
ncbi:MAG: ATP-binding protein [Thermodesulfobacteriota bacterium]